MSGFIDIHQHLLFGVDDGPRDIEGTKRLLSAAWDDGIDTIIATAHATPGMQAFDAERYFAHLKMVQQLCAQQFPGLKVFEGAEIFYTDATCRLLRERRIPTLAGTEYVLVEFSPAESYEKIVAALESLLHGGYLPIAAHVERYRNLVMHPKRACEMKRSLDVRFQVNCSTVVGGKDFFVERFCKKLFQEELIDAVATDAHNTTTRPPRMREAYRRLRKLYGETYASHLTGVTGGIVF